MDLLYLTYTQSYYFRLDAALMLVSIPAYMNYCSLFVVIYSDLISERLLGTYRHSYLLFVLFVFVLCLYCVGDFVVVRVVVVVMRPCDDVYDDDY